MNDIGKDKNVEEDPSKMPEHGDNGTRRAPPQAKDFQRQTGDDGVWSDPKITIPERSELVWSAQFIPGISDLPSYSIRNGKPEDVTPYLLTWSTVASCYHWVPVDGIRGDQALDCVDAFIKSALYQLKAHTAHNMNDADTRTAAIILGTCRAVMTHDYDLRPRDLNSEESRSPLLSASKGADDTIRYAVLLPEVTDGTSTPTVDYHVHLTNPLNLSDAEKRMMRVIARSAEAIIPIQGVNLINEEEYYLSDPKSQSFKAFKAVENQVWVAQEWKTYITGREGFIRDLMWHKAGHPVSIAIKEAAATSSEVKAKLVAAKLGSVTARLPALETDVRKAQTYVKLFRAVDSIWAEYGGGIDFATLTTRLQILEKFPRCHAADMPAITIADTVIRNRKDAIDELKRVVERNMNLAAVAYGFYCAMINDLASEGDTTATKGEILWSFSLTKLKNNATGSYVNGVELYRDYRALKRRRNLIGHK